ncbi:MAG: DNA translocase FtsK [Chloroflexota bacterium]|nr:DNA translocase FtsK [Chloroflexota bacterium]
MRQQLLEHQADRIEMVLASHKIPVRVYGGTVTSQTTRFQILPPLGVKLSKIRSLAEEIALALGAEGCRIQRREGALEVEVPRDDPQPVHLLPLCERLRGRVPSCTALLGRDGEGAPILLRLSSPQVAHVLVAGTTGSGKTALLRTMAASLVFLNRPHQLQLALVDPKGRGLGPLASLPHLGWPLAREAGEAVKLLGEVVEEMERRDRAGHSEPHLVLIADELADLVQVGGGEVVELLTRLVQRGRQAGIHVVAATQRPTSKLLGGLMKANFPVRLVGRVMSARDALLAAGVGGTRAERLKGRGAFVMVAEGRVSRLQAAYITQGELERLANSPNSDWGEEGENETRYLLQGGSGQYPGLGGGGQPGHGLGLRGGERRGDRPVVLA